MVSERPLQKAPEVPEPVPPGASAAASYNARNTNPQRLIWVLLGVVLLLALFVLFVLPYKAYKPTDSPVLATPSVKPAPEPGGDNSVARNDAEQALQAYLRQRSRPQLANAEQWGEQQWDASIEAAAEGDRHLGRGTYAQARQAYQQAGRLLQELEDNRQSIFDAYLDRADSLLAENRSGPAADQYQFCLLMEPGHAEASNGLARARVRDLVLDHMRTGKQAESTGQLEEATTSYRLAVALDPVWQPAHRALAEVEAQLAEQRFTQAVNQTLAGLDEGRLAAAGEALQRAAQIDPDAPVINDLRSRLAAQRKQASLENLRRLSRQRAEEENWAAAEKFYRKALTIEPQNSFASAGLAQALDRINLHRQLDHYLLEPSRIFSAQPLANAEQLLSGNTSIPASEPKLQDKVARLRKLVQAARQPREVVLHSDGQTDVTIYHLRRLGSFTEKRLSLVPGKYTAVGNRTGYRDVRRVFMIEPDKPAPVITVRCEEPL